MKKKNYTLASATILGLAIATSGGAAFADESTTTPAPTTPVTSATAAPSATPSEAPSTGGATPSSNPIDNTVASSAAAPKTTEKDIVLVHTNDVHGRIVEESRFKNI